MALIEPGLEPKRMKLEHFSTYDDKYVLVKKDPENEVIEIDYEGAKLKTEPTNEIHSFEYRNVLNDQYVVDPEEDFKNIEPPLLHFDPLAIADTNHESASASADDLDVTLSVEEHQPEGNCNEKNGTPPYSKTERNLSKQIRQLQKELKVYMNKERALRKELEEMEASEWALREQNTRVIHDLNQQLQNMEKKYTKELEEYKAALQLSHAELEKMNLECTSQKKELERMNNKIVKITEILADDGKNEQEFVTEKDQLLMPTLALDKIAAENTSLSGATKKEKVHRKRAKKRRGVNEDECQNRTCQYCGL